MNKKRITYFSKDDYDRIEDYLFRCSEFLRLKEDGSRLTLDQILFLDISKSIERPSYIEKYYIDNSTFAHHQTTNGASVLAYKMIIKHPEMVPEIGVQMHYSNAIDAISDNFFTEIDEYSKKLTFISEELKVVKNRIEDYYENVSIKFSFGDDGVLSIILKINLDLNELGSIWCLNTYGVNALAA